MKTEADASLNIICLHVGRHLPIKTAKEQTDFFESAIVFPFLYVVTEMSSAQRLYISGFGEFRMLLEAAC